MHTLSDITADDVDEKDASSDEEDVNDEEDEDDKTVDPKWMKIHHPTMRM